MAAIAAMVVLAAVAAMLLLSALDPVARKQRQHRQTEDALAEARDALVGWTVSHPVVPGMMPFPDRNGDGNYDGRCDCLGPSVAAGNHLLLGRAPWKEQDVWFDAKGNMHAGFCEGGKAVGGLSVNVFDGAGERLWLAISRNLVRDSDGGGYVMPVVDWASPDASPWPWLTVRDRAGFPVAERVAAVIIAPGRTLPGQNRGGDAPGVSNYLDEVTVDGVTYSNADFDGDFIAYPDTQSDPTSSQHFNDRLTYVTVDDLMPLLERRVLSEVEAALADYQQAAWNPNGSYPWLSPFSNPVSSSFDGEVGCRAGHLPIHLRGEVFSTTFTVEWDIRGAQLSDGGPLGAISDLELRQGRQRAVGDCRWSDAESVDCTGTASEAHTAASGEQVSRTYTFDFRYEGDVTVNAPGEDSTRTRRVAIDGPLTAFGSESVTVSDRVAATSDAEDGKVVSQRTLTIDGDSSGRISVSGIKYDLDPNLPELPDWFLVNHWHRLIYISYAQAYQPGINGSCVPGRDCLTLRNALGPASGDKKMLLVSAGLELSGHPLYQDRDTGNLDAYYENANSVPGDDLFERHAPMRGFNDQVRTVAWP
ncbi:MAG: hypothetical protein QNK18_02515 [Gammaproteobacteria bacterium]|nr:hypothetical protein [Gammaproteobacteria bacterium]